MQPFRIWEHTADAGFEAFGSTRDQVFVNAARALSYLIVYRPLVLEPSPRDGERKSMWISRTRSLSLVLSWSSLLAALGLMSPVAGLCVLLGLYTIQEVKPKVFALIPDDVIDQECDPLFSRPATAGFIVTSGGVVVVDTTNRSDARSRPALRDPQTHRPRPFATSSTPVRQAITRWATKFSRMKKPR